MPRFPRTVEPVVAYPVTQCGVYQQDVFFTTTDRTVYFSLIEDQVKDACARVLGFCLMANHVHWVIVPERPDSLAILFRRVHGRYAQYLNAKLRRSGHPRSTRKTECGARLFQTRLAVRAAPFALPAKPVLLLRCRAIAGG